MKRERADVQRRLAYLDGLRAIAVMSVAVSHARVHVLGSGLEPWAKEACHGVDLFFVLSGFCLTFPTLEKLSAGGSVRFDTLTYALKRVLRILPPYFATIAILEGVAVYCTRHGLAVPGGLRALPFGDVMSNVFLLDGTHTYVNESFWTLGIEFRWYFLVPLALALAVKNMRAFVSLIVLVAIAGELTRAGSTDVGVLPAFLLGIVAAYVRVRRHPIARYALPLGGFSFVYAMLNEARPHYPLNTNVGWHAVAFFVVVAAGTLPWLRAVLAWRPLASIGIASYSIYLVHEPIVAELSPRLNPVLGTFGSLAACVTAGVAAGGLLWFAVERPLTEPAFVARFVASGRMRMARLFALAGAAPSFELIAPNPAAAVSVNFSQQGFAAPALKQGAL